MDDEEELDFAVRGVVRGGQVVIDTPLDVPDGTLVTIRPYRNGDVPVAGSDSTPLTGDQIRWFREFTERLRARAMVGRDDPRAA